MGSGTMTAVDTSKDRLVVADVLRGVAILAMLIAHARRLLPEVGDFHRS